MLKQYDGLHLLTSYKDLVSNVNNYIMRKCTFMGR